MKITFSPKLKANCRLLNISVSVKGLIDCGDYNNMVTFTDVNFRISDEPPLACKTLTRWFKNNAPIDGQDNWDIAVKETVTRVWEFWDNIENATPCEIDHKYDNWSLSVKLETTVVESVQVSLSRTAEELTPSILIDTKEIDIWYQKASAEGRTPDVDAEKAFFKTLAYWSRLNNYRPSDDIKENELIAFYHAWVDNLKLPERAALISYAQSLQPLTK